jgi:hypothetical protein
LSSGGEDHTSRIRGIRVPLHQAAYLERVNRTTCGRVGRPQRVGTGPSSATVASATDWNVESEPGSRSRRCLSRARARRSCSIASATGWVSGTRTLIRHRRRARLGAAASRALRKELTPLLCPRGRRRRARTR